MNHKHQIISETPPPEEAFEIARLWVVNQGPSYVYINAGIMPKPKHFGLLLADAAMQGAKAYAKRLGMSEKRVLEMIWEAVDAERRQPTGDLVIGDDGEDD